MCDTLLSLMKDVIAWKNGDEDARIDLPRVIASRKQDRFSTEAVPVDVAGDHYPAQVETHLEPSLPYASWTSKPSSQGAKSPHHLTNIMPVLPHRMVLRHTRGSLMS